MSVTEARKQSPLSLSSDMLDMHLEELEEECIKFLSLLQSLRAMAADPNADEDERATAEGELYASLSHFSHHVQPALDEMDRLLDEMPDDQEDDEESD